MKKMKSCMAGWDWVKTCWSYEYMYTYVCVYIRWHDSLEDISICVIYSIQFTSILLYSTSY
jgi:hypothetical protein